MIRIDVEIVVNDYVLGDSFTTFDPEGGAALMKSKIKSDKYQALVGDGKARVTVPMVETQGGPGYSSVKVGVEISVQVDQSTEAIEKATHLLMQESMMLVDTYVTKGYNMLLAHRAQLDKMHD